MILHTLPMAAILSPMSVSGFIEPLQLAACGRRATSEAFLDRTCQNAH